MTPRFNIGNICNAPRILYGLMLGRHPALAGVVCIRVIDIIKKPFF